MRILWQTLKQLWFIAVCRLTSGQTESSEHGCFEYVILKYYRWKNQFEETYSKTLRAFNQFLKILRPDVAVDLTIFSVCSTKNALPIIPELFLHCFFRNINRGSYIDAHLMANIRKASFYRCVNVCFRSIFNSDCIDLAINFDLNPLTLLRGRRYFAAFSNHRIIFKYIGRFKCVLIEIKCPSGVPKPRDYYSDDYCKYSVTVQAVLLSRLFVHIY